MRLWKKSPPTTACRCIKSEVKEIIALDDQNQAGLKARYAKILQEAQAEEFLKKLQQQVQVAYQKDGPDAALKLVAGRPGQPGRKIQPRVADRTSPRRKSFCSSRSRRPSRRWRRWMSW